MFDSSIGWHGRLITRIEKGYDLTRHTSPLVPGKYCMSQISVVPVTTNAQKKQFLELPWKLYADNEYWVPPLRMDQKEMVGYAKHPFYLENEAQTFLATSSE